MGLISNLIDLVRNEPAVVGGFIAGAIVLAAGHFGILLDKPTVTAVVTPIILGIVLRFKVSPAK